MVGDNVHLLEVVAMQVDQVYSPSNEEIREPPCDDTAVIWCLKVVPLVAEHPGEYLLASTEEIQAHDYLNEQFNRVSG
jgi:hypothetical protein